MLLELVLKSEEGALGEEEPEASCGGCRDDQADGLYDCSQHVNERSLEAGGDLV